jgi:nucleotide-binding universal stress UspA family protein
MTKRPVLVVPDTAAFHPVEQIVFAADLTNKHPCSLTELVSMARLFNARILFLHVLTKKSLLKSNLARVHYSDLYSLTGYEKVSFHIREDTDIEKGILDFSREKKADLIVMINHEKNLLESLFLGSHTKQMAYHSPLPLLAIHT